MKKIILFLGLGCFLHTLLAQNVILEGRILGENQAPLPFANIYLSNQSIGTTTNANGRFQLVIPTDYQQDSLHISYLGYQTYSVFIPDFQTNPAIQLRPSKAFLQEVVVSGLTVSTILERAINRIPKNYNTAPFVSKGFYRVTSQKEANYIHLSEAVFEIFQSKKDKIAPQFKLIKMRAIKDEHASKGIELGMKPAGIFELDLVQHYQSSDLLNKKGLKRHQFRLEGTIDWDGREVYKINFDQLEFKWSGYKGYMLIDKETYAFVYFNFGLSKKGLRYKKFGSSAQRTLMKLLGINIKMDRNDFKIQYHFNGRYYHLKSVGNDARLHFKSNREHYNFTANTRVDYLVNEIIDQPAAAFSPKEILGKGQLIEGQHSIYESEFWKNYNIILPTSNFTAIAKTLEANNQANAIKETISLRINKLPKNNTLRIDSIITAYHDKGLFNGTVLIQEADSTILHKSYNNAYTKNNPNTQFRIGSLSKTFTAFLILQLREAGLLDFQDPIQKFLPNFAYGDITIDQLLSHQSGIPNLLSNPNYLAQIMSTPYPLDTIVDRFCQDTLAFPPGSQFAYSNSNYILLSLIAEKTTNLRFSELLQSYIFAPLNMAQTHYGLPPKPNQLVQGYLYNDPEPTYHITNTGGAGGIITTAQDLLKWSKALTTDQLLPQSTIQELFVPRAAYLDWDADYAYGWMIDKYLFQASKKHSIRYHPGTDFGFHSMFVQKPDTETTIILLGNTGEFPRFEMTDLILEVMR